MGGASGYIIAACHRISDFFSSVTKTLLRWLFTDAEICRWSASAAGLGPTFRLGHPLRLSGKKALLEEQISAQRCCKCHAVIVRRAGIPCTLMTLTLNMCHAWGNPTLMLRSAGLITRTASVSILPLWELYEHLPPLDESVAAHLCPPTAIGWKERVNHPSKPCRATSALTGHAYSAAGQAASALHSMAVLQVFQAKMLANEEAGLDSASLRDLRSVTDLVLRVSQVRSRLSCDTSSLSAPALPLLPIAPDLRWLSRQLNQRQPPPEPRPPEGRRDRGRSCSAWRYPFPKRQGPRPKIALDPEPQKSSWTARQREEGPDSRYRWTIPQAGSIVSLAAPLSAGRRGKCVHGSSRAHYSAQVSDRCDGGQNKTYISKREQHLFLPTISVLPLCSQSAQPF